VPRYVRQSRRSTPSAYCGTRSGLAESCGPRAKEFAAASPQELQIAQLAAEGLSNREIGEQLYLSHRTVESHLYRLFPKLGVTSRAQLRDALNPAPGS
jgi:DNA-binding NarL/FixJ family response regulator